jgi:23S rRNA (guanosine2251-2'-O)-methyltransferase
LHRNKPDKTTMASKTGLTTLPDNAVKARSGLLLYGYHSVIAALSNVQRDPIQLFATEEAADKLRTGSTQPLPPITCLSRTQLAQMLKSKQSEQAILPHQGLILHTKPLEQPDLSDLVNLLHSGKPHRRFLILDQVTDPRNIGAILRSARAFGTDAIILTSRHAPDETGALAKAAAGALEDVPLVRVNNLARALATLKEHFVTLAGLEATAPANINQLATTTHLGLIMGSEGSGLRRLTREACDIMTSIDMAESSESLNVSVAAAIALYATQFQG